MDFDERERRNYAKRRSLCEHEPSRWEALAAFPLSVGSLCDDLRRALKARRDGCLADDLCEELSLRIRWEFERQFGYDIIEALVR